MSDRETKTIITPIDKKSVVIKAWLTGREQRAINNILMQEISVGENEEGAESAVKKIGSDAVNAHQDAKIMAVVVSIDGDTTAILDKVLDFKSADFTFTVKAIDEAVTGISEDDKKK